MNISFDCQLTNVTAIKMGFMLGTQKLDPEKVGLIEFGKQKTWDQQAIGLIAEIQSKSFDRVSRERKAEYAKAQAAERRAMNERKTTSILNPRYWRARVRHRRAMASTASHHSMLSKLDILQRISILIALESFICRL